LQLGLLDASIGILSNLIFNHKNRPKKLNGEKPELIFWQWKIKRGQYFELQFN